MMTRRGGEGEGGGKIQCVGGGDMGAGDVGMGTGGGRNRAIRIIFKSGVSGISIRTKK